MPPKARKNVLLMVTNVGSTSREKNSPTEEPFLDKAKYAMKILVEKKIFLQPKDEIGIITMGDETNNPYDVDNVNIYEENLLIPNWEMIKYINDLESKNYKSNWIEGLHAALSYLQQEVFDPNFNVFLVLFNNFKEDDESINEYDPDVIANELRNYNLHLIFVGEKTEKELTEDPSTSEKFALEIIEKSDDPKPQYEYLNSFIERRRFYNIPPTNPMPWKFDLEWGNLCIPCAEFIRTSDDSKLESWKLASDKSSRLFKDSVNADNVSETEIVKVVKRSLVLDRHRNEVPAEDIISGYEFGGKYVSCNDQDETALKYMGSTKGMMVYGFVPRDEVKLEYWSGIASRIVVPETIDSSEAFYTFLQAMVQSNVVAIVRKVYANNNVPKMGVLFPKVDDDDIWCLVHIEIPFAEDLRYIEKKPIKSIEESMPKEKLDALDDFIDSMTVNDNDVDYLNPGMFPNIQRQYLWNAIADRALNPEGPLLPLNEYIQQYLKPPKDLQIKSESAVKKLGDVFNDWNIGKDEKPEPDINSNSDDENNLENEMIVQPDIVKNDDENSFENKTPECTPKEANVTEATVPDKKDYYDAEELSMSDIDEL